MLPLHYQYHSLRLRDGRAVLTIAGVALVVGVFAYLLCFADGLRAALARTGDPHNLIVLAEAATAESNSALWPADVQHLQGLDTVATGAGGRPLVAPAYVVQTNVVRRGDPRCTPVGITVRGVDREVMEQVYPALTLQAGRWFQPGTDELVIGARAARQFTPGEVGATIECGERVFTIVGVFSAGGGVHDSELWGHGPNVAHAYRRELYSCATLRLRSVGAGPVGAAVERIRSAGIALRAVPEPEYFSAQTQNARMLEALALFLVFIMGGGAVFAAMNTVYAFVAARAREFAMLRVLGYRRRDIALGVLLESLLLTLLGGAIGCAACAVVLLATNDTKDLVATSTFTSVAFSVRPTVKNTCLALGVAAVIGVLGGLGPARGAGRQSLVEALRGV